jgi:hypothetical protein
MTAAGIPFSLITPQIPMQNLSDLALEMFIGDEYILR